MASIYLNPEFLSWFCDVQGSSGFGTDYISRSYEMWRHAKDKVYGDHTDLDKIDCLSSLKRSVNHRIKAIYQAHKIETLPSQLGRKKTLEKLQEFGIIRPAIIKDMFIIRNEIEHEDKEPPDSEICRRQVDIVWYFLKSTDGLINMSHDDILYMHPDDSWAKGREVSINATNKWDAYELQATVSKCMVRVRKPADDWLKIDKAEKKPEKNNLLSISGEFVLSGDYIKIFAHDFFSTYGYFVED